MAARTLSALSPRAPQDLTWYDQVAIGDAILVAVVTVSHQLAYLLRILLYFLPTQVRAATQVVGLVGSCINSRSYLLVVRPAFGIYCSVG